MEKPGFILAVGGIETTSGGLKAKIVPCHSCGVSRRLSPSGLFWWEQGVPVFCGACAPSIESSPMLSEEQRQELERAFNFPLSWEQYRQLVEDYTKTLRRPPGGRG